MIKLKLVEILIDDLKLANYNPRKDLVPEDEEYQKIEMSINQFGLVEPFIVNKTSKGYVLISGHQRLKVIKGMGYETVQCIVVKLTKNKEMALNLALNKITNEWDEEKLIELIKEFDSEDIDHMITGFSERELNVFINKYNKESDEILSGDKENKEIICPRCKKNILE